MNGSIGAGMLRGWVMLWSMELTWLLAGTALAVAVGAAVETIAAIRRWRH